MLEAAECREINRNEKNPQTAGWMWRSIKTQQLQHTQTHSHTFLSAVGIISCALIDFMMPVCIYNHKFKYSNSGSGSQNAVISSHSASRSNTDFDFGSESFQFIPKVLDQDWSHLHNKQGKTTS